MLEKYSYLWDGTSSDSWALLHVNFSKPDEVPRYLVVNMTTRQALAIRDDELSQRIKEEMLRRGSAVVSVGNGF